MPRLGEYLLISWRFVDPRLAGCLAFGFGGEIGNDPASLHGAATARWRRAMSIGLAVAACLLLAIKLGLMAVDHYPVVRRRAFQRQFRRVTPQAYR